MANHTSTGTTSPRHQGSPDLVAPTPAARHVVSRPGHCLQVGMVPEFVLRIWDRQRELALAEIREKRARALIDAANRRVTRALEVMRLT